MKPRFILACILTLFLIPSTTLSHAQTEWQVLSSITCTRGTGKPIIETFTFSAMGGTAILKIINGSLTDGDIEKVSSSTFTLNGTQVCGPDDFNQKVDSVVKQINLLNGQNELKVCLKGKSGSQLVFQITQGVAEVTPEISVIQTANALRIGNIDFALKGFYPDEKRKALLYSLNSEDIDDLANFIQNAEFIEESDNMRSYRYTWIDESGENFADFYLVKDFNGNWVIMNW